MFNGIIVQRGRPGHVLVRRVTLFCVQSLVSSSGSAHCWGRTTLNEFYTLPVSLRPGGPGGHFHIGCETHVRWRCRPSRGGLACAGVGQWVFLIQ